MMSSSAAGLRPTREHQIVCARTLMQRNNAAALLLETQWTVTGGTWADPLADVARIEIDIERINNSGGTDIEAIDNIELVSHPKGFSPK